MSVQHTQVHRINFAVSVYISHQNFNPRRSRFRNSTLWINPNSNMEFPYWVALCIHRFLHIFPLLQGKYRLYLRLRCTRCIHRSMWRRHWTPGFCTDGRMQPPTQYTLFQFHIHPEGQHICTDYRCNPMTIWLLYFRQQPSPVCYPALVPSKMHIQACSAQYFRRNVYYRRLRCRLFKHWSRTNRNIHYAVRIRYANFQSHPLNVSKVPSVVISRKVCGWLPGPHDHAR